MHLSNPIESMDAKKILERARDVNSRVPQQYSLDKKLVKDLRDYAAAKNIAASRIVEELLKEFLLNAYKEKK